jgi:hypothetical protein
MPDDEQTYPITYSVDYHDPPLTKEQVLASAAGGCDAILLISVVGGRSGASEGSSHAFIGRDGRGGDGDINIEEWFKAWAMLAATLAESTELGPGKRRLCAEVIFAIRKVMEVVPDAG